MGDLPKLDFPVPSRIPIAVADALHTTVSKETEDIVSKIDFASLQAFQKAANFLSVAQIYLKDNVLLQQPLSREHLKPRLLGHHGTTPGLILIYAHATALLSRHEESTADAIQDKQPKQKPLLPPEHSTWRRALYVTGPGHGAPGVLASLFLEGSISRFHQDESQSAEGVHNFVKKFSWPGLDRPSHLNGSVPGCIHEGGELGYALGVAYGAIMDKPDLLAIAVIGDGEAETGPTAAAWQSHKYIDPSESGAVLPILHCNRFKIAEPTIFGTMDDAELLALFTGYGFMPRIVSYDTLVKTHTVPGDEAAIEFDREMARSMEWAYAEIIKIQNAARFGTPITKPRWPMLIVISPKGWGAPATLDGLPLENSFRTHQVPISQPHQNDSHFDLLTTWLKSYEPDKWFRPSKQPFLAEVVTRLLPKNPTHRMGQLVELYQPPPELSYPSWTAFAAEKGSMRSEMDACGDLVAKFVDCNRHTFRIFSPDELVSNHLGKVLDGTTTREFQADPATSVSSTGQQNGGRVIEMLSEHTLQAFAQGYTLMGNLALFPSYESFLPIVTTMIEQYAKFLKNLDEVTFRPKTYSITYVETSTLYRQEHNGSSHQNPGLINTIMNLPHATARVYLPPDSNTALSTMDHCFRSHGYINLIVGSKHPSPTWLSAEEAHQHCVAGASVWRAYSSDEGRDPDVVLVGCGVETTAEVIAAQALLARDVPTLRVRVVNITDLLILSDRGEHPHALSDEQLVSLFTADKPVVFNFHGYPSVIKGLLGDRLSQLCCLSSTKHEHNLQIPRKMKVLGFVENGTTTTPWSMLRVNGTDRFSVAEATLRLAAHRSDTDAGVRAHELIANYQSQRRFHEKYVLEHGEDPADFVALPSPA
ncbi:hypothetical protein OC844_003737 [Tilletia horrida]|nr:hypothetical protein OC844_003737 [Tilletia horrida]